MLLLGPILPLIDWLLWKHPGFLTNCPLAGSLPIPPNLPYGLTGVHTQTDPKSPYLEHLAFMFTGLQGFLQLQILVLGAAEAGTVLGQGLCQALHLLTQSSFTLLHLGQGPAQPFHCQLQSPCLHLTVCHLADRQTGR